MKDLSLLKKKGILSYSPWIKAQTCRLILTMTFPFIEIHESERKKEEKKFRFKIFSITNCHLRELMMTSKKNILRRSTKKVSEA